MRRHFFVREKDVVFLFVHHLNSAIADSGILFRVRGVIGHTFKVGRYHLNDNIRLGFCHSGHQIGGIADAVHDNIFGKVAHTGKELQHLVLGRAGIGIFVFSRLKAEIAEARHGLDRNHTL